MPEELLVRCCAPTLAGMKSGSLFACPYQSTEQLKMVVRDWNHRLSPKGLRVVVLRTSEKRAMIYVFRPKDLQNDLLDTQAAALLKTRGYNDLRVSPCVSRLADRFRQGEEFPHEVGLFLGYPPEDVQGFIENKACGQKCVGCWKVYGDEEAAKKTFEKYKKCTKVYYSQWEQGKSIERLTVAN